MELGDEELLTQIHGIKFDFSQTEFLLKMCMDDSNLYYSLKANIICSRRKLVQPFQSPYQNWSSHYLRDIIFKNYHLIHKNLDLRWKISLLECFVHDGSISERLTSSIISTLNRAELLNPTRFILEAHVPNEHDIVKVIIDVKSQIPFAKIIGLLALDILKQYSLNEIGIFHYKKFIKKDCLDIIMDILYSNEYDTGILYRKFHKDLQSIKIEK